MKLAVALLCLLATAAQAETCPKLEFAELDAMPREELLRLRCEYNAKMVDPKLYEAGRYGIGVATRCSDEATRMERILARKYALQAGSDPKLPYYEQVNALCRR